MLTSNASRVTLAAEASGLEELVSVRSFVATFSMTLTGKLSCVPVSVLKMGLQRRLG